MKLTTAKSDGFFENYSTDLFNNVTDIDLMSYYYNPIKIVDAVNSVDDRTFEILNITDQKNYKKIHIASHADIYNFSIESNVKNVFIV
jgi:hypothetical protein